MFTARILPQDKFSLISPVSQQVTFVIMTAHLDRSNNTPNVSITFIKVCENGEEEVGPLAYLRAYAGSYRATDSVIVANDKSGL